MSSAFGEPPDSGVNVSAKADGAQIRDAKTTALRAVRSRRLGMPVGKAAGSYIRLREGLHFVPDDSSARGSDPARSRRCGRTSEGSDPLERGLPLLDEGGHALLEVLGAGELVLEVGLEVELAVEVGIEHPVERALGAGVGARGPGSEPLDQ